MLGLWQNMTGRIVSYLNLWAFVKVHLCDVKTSPIFLFLEFFLGELD